MRLGSDQEKMERYTGEHVGQLIPNRWWKRRLCPSTHNKDPHLLQHWLLPNLGMQRLPKRDHASQSFVRQPSRLFGVRAVLVNDSTHGSREGQKLANVPPATVGLYRVEVSSIEEDIPIRHVDGLLEALRSRQLEFGHFTPGAQVVFVFVAFAQSSNVLAMLGVLGPFLFAIVRRPTAIGAFKVHESSHLVLRHADGARGKRADAFTTCANRGDGRL